MKRRWFVISTVLLLGGIVALALAPFVRDRLSLSGFANESTAEPDNSSAIFTGIIDDNFVTWIERQEPGATVQVSSQGGLASAALEAGVIMARDQIHLRIYGYCLSTCADYLLPSAASVTFVGHPLIGFHGNDLIFERFLLEMNEDVAAERALTCLNARARALSGLYASETLDPDFIGEQIDHLGATGLELSSAESRCPRFRLRMANEYWLPTSEQIRAWGLRFTGEVCADDAECVRGQLRRRWGEGLRFMVGDEVVVS